MIKIQLTNEQRLELESFRKQASSKDSEKALMILLNNDGKSAPEIALMLKRNQHTVRDWLKRYKNHGIKGLSRNFSPGRPNTMREKIKQQIAKIIGNSPMEHGYQDATWSVPLITYEVNKNLNLNASSKTVTRALKDMGYVYKRPIKTTTGMLRPKEEAKEGTKMVREILIIAKGSVSFTPQDGFKKPFQVVKRCAQVQKIVPLLCFFHNFGA